MCKILVGMSTCGISAGARDTYNKLAELLDGGEDQLDITGCIGMCFREPLVEVREGGRRTIYGDVDPKKAEEIVETHIRGGEELTDYVVFQSENGTAVAGQEKSFLEGQTRIVLRNCGVINPDSIEEYEGSGGYQATRKALLEMKPEAIVEEMKASGLRGRGGAGFPTGLKWSFAAGNAGDVKYVVCNADEGDPGAFMDRSILEGDPHAVLEGMIICGKPPRGAGGNDHLRQGHRRCHRVYLLSRRVPAGHPPPGNGDHGGSRKGLPWHEHPRLWF